MEQSSILSAKFDCPVARQTFSLLATVHDCETGILLEVRDCSTIETKFNIIWVEGEAVNPFTTKGEFD